MRPASGAFLIVGPSWIGDMVMAQSLFKHLKEQHPEARIDVLAPAWSQALLSRMPEVRRSIKAPLSHGRLSLKTRFELGSSLRDAGYSWAIILPRSWKAALIPFWAGIPLRTGYLGELRYILLNDIRKLDRSVMGKTVERFVALGCERDVSAPPAYQNPALQVDTERSETLQRDLGLQSEAPKAALMPGAAYGPAKQWPASRFCEVARHLLQKGWEVWVLGSSKDAPVGEEICRQCDGAPRNLCGRTTLEEAIDLIGATEVAVTNDSGLMHVAAAVDTRVVAVFGSSSPEYTPPLTARAAMLTSPMECRPCFARQCAEGHYQCLHDIAAEEAIAKIEELCRMG